MTPEQIESLSRIAAAAVESEKATGMPAEVTCAQCALESGYLAHAPGQNPFGIKAAPRHTKTQVLMTTEFEDGHAIRVPATFAAFDSLADAFIDHANLITGKPVYRKAWEQYQSDRDLDAFVRNMARKYATDPKYSEKLLGMIRNPNFVAALAKARASA